MTRLIDQSGTTATAISLLSRPPGADYADVLLLSSYEDVVNFEKKVDLDPLSSKTFYFDRVGSRENQISALVEIKDPRRCVGTQYIGFRNPSSTYGIAISIEVVAIVQEIINENTTSTTNDKIAETLYLEGQKLSEQGKNGEAASKFESILNLGDPRYEVAEIYNAVGWHCILDKQFSKAIKFLRKGVEKDEYNLYLWGNLAHAYLLIEEVEKAKEIYLKYKNQNLSSDLSWKKMVETDFEDFKKRGIQSENYQLIKNLLGI